MICTHCGETTTKNSGTCPRCGEPLSSDTQPQPHGYQSPNRLLSDAEQEQFINSAAWGPAVTWIYFLGMRAWIAAIVVLVSAFIPFISLIVFIFCIFYGRRVAWSNRADQDFSAFKIEQQTWDTWSKRYYIVSFGLMILAVVCAMLLVTINPAARVKRAQDAVKTTSSTPVQQSATN
jgi:hypothetical protein